MLNKYAKIALPVALAVSTLGMGVATIATPAGAATKAKAKAKVVTVKSETLTGTIVRTQAAKHVFWFKVTTKEYRAVYGVTTKFMAGSTASLVKGKTVTVTGTPMGKSGAVIKATSISA